MGTVFGLDFGTTNSALSANQGDKVEIIDIDEYNSAGETMRSVIYFDEDERRAYVGHEAIARYVENGGVGRFLQSIKSFLPSALFEHTVINRKEYQLEDIIAIILKNIKEKGEKRLGQKVEDAVMGRPVIFSEDKKKDKLAEQRLRRAAELAGFKNIIFQLEPIAAALTFEKSLQKGEEKIVFIGDFGGGTSDFTIIKLRGGRNNMFDRENDVLSLGGVYIAGDTFDSELMWSKVAQYFGKNVKYKDMTGQWLNMPLGITQKLRNWHLIPQLKSNKTREYIRQMKATADDVGAIANLENLIEDNYGFMLFQSIEKAKIELSSRDISKIIFQERKLRINEEVSKKQFEEIISDYVRRIEMSIDETMACAGMLIPKDVDVVFTTGGTSHIPVIRKIFIDKFGQEKMRQMDAFTSVAYGLGVSASMTY